MLDPKLKKAAVADINTTQDGFTALHFAASECQVEVVKELVKRPGIFIDSVNNEQRTPLHIAAQRGSLEICRILCECPSVDKNPKDIDENTPLHLASQCGAILCIIYLVKDCGCDTEIKNKFGFKPYDLAFNMEVRNIFDKLNRQSSLTPG